VVEGSAVINHSNIHVDSSRDDCRVVIDLSEDCQLSIDTDTIGEFIEKLVPHKRHARVAELLDRIREIV
jgi:hypothetical protein